MTTAIVFKKTLSGYDIQFRYDPVVVSEIKQFIPSYVRKFDPNTRAWSTNESWAIAFEVFAKSQGWTTSGIGGSAKPPPPPPPPPPMLAAAPPKGSWADELMRRLPNNEMRQAVHRNLSKVLHADLGGDHDLQQELNDARAKFS